MILRGSTKGLGMLLPRPHRAALSQFGGRWGAVPRIDISELVLPSCTFTDTESIWQHFNFKFFQKSMCSSLAALNKALEMAAPSMHQTDLDKLMSCCEEWTGVRQIAARRPADLHAILRCHALLQLPLSATLRANTRHWLDVKCAALSPAELFPFFGSLSALAVGVGSSCSDHPKPTAEPTCADLSAEVQWLAGVACQARQHLHRASPADIWRLLGDFARLRVETEHPRLPIMEELLANLTLTQRCSQFSPEDKYAFVKVMKLAGLESLREFRRMYMMDTATEGGDGCHALQKVVAKNACPPLHTMISKGCDAPTQTDSLLTLHQVLAGLEKLELTLALYKARPFLASQSGGRKDLLNNSVLWPLLLERAKNTAQFKGDWQFLQALIKVLMWVPDSVDARQQIQELMAIIGRDLKDEIAQVLRFTSFQACIGQCRKVCRWLNRRLCLDLFCVNGQLWHPQSLVDISVDVDTILRCLALVPAIAHDERFSCAAPPSAQWWAAFRQRIADDSFKPTVENWTSIVTIINGLNFCSNVSSKYLFSKLSMDNRLSTPKRDHSFILPSAWYSMFIDLAHRELLENKASFFSHATRLLDLMVSQHICLDDAHKAQLTATIERFCAEYRYATADQFTRLLCHALSLELAISAETWQLGIDRKLFSNITKHHNRLLNTAASSWALQLTTAPSEPVLHSLINALAFDESVTTTTSLCWQRLHLFLGEEFIPNKILDHVNSRCSNSAPNSKKALQTEPRTANGSTELLKRLAAKFGDANVQMNVTLPAIPDKKVDYLVTKLNGSQKVFLCASGKFYNWSIPEDRRGGPTTRTRVFIHILEKIGYEVELVDD